MLASLLEEHVVRSKKVRPEVLEFLWGLQYKLGFTIQNESELIDRLLEARDWRYALLTLVEKGDLFGITFKTEDPSLTTEKLAQMLIWQGWDSNKVAKLSKGLLRHRSAG